MDGENFLSERTVQRLLKVGRVLGRGDATKYVQMALDRNKDDVGVAKWSLLQSYCDLVTRLR